MGYIVKLRVKQGADYTHPLDRIQIFIANQSFSLFIWRFGGGYLVDAVRPYILQYKLG
jgi:hypothetical protein